MIERALREVNEEGGSSEESISNFIRKEYDDLPWSHLTLLKHHLQSLCQCGDIILTSGQHYLLPSADSTLNSGKKSRKKQTRKKRDRDWEIKRRNRRCEGNGKDRLLQEDDQMHEMQNCIILGLEQKNLEAEARTDTLKLCVVGEDGEQIGGDQTSISAPERPPVFDCGRLEESFHSAVCCKANTCQIMHPMRRRHEDVVSTVEGLFSNQKQRYVFNVYDEINHEEENVISSTDGNPVTRVDQTLQDVQPLSKINGIVLQQSNSQEDPAMFVETCSQKELPESELRKSTAAISETEPVNLTEGGRLTNIVFKYQRRPPAIRVAKQNDISCRTQEIKDEAPQQRKPQCLGKKQLFDKSIASSTVQHVQHGLSQTNEVHVNRSEHQGGPTPAVKTSCEGQYHPEEIIEVLDSGPSASSLLQHQPRDHELSEKNELQEVKSGTSKRLEHQGLRNPAAKSSCEEHQESEALVRVPDGFAVSSLSVCLEQQSRGDAHDFSMPSRSSELKAVEIGKSSPATPRMQRQRTRWSLRLSNMKRSQPEVQAAAESNRVRRKQAKFYSQKKRTTGQPEVALASSVYPKQENSQKFSNLSSLQMHHEVEPQTQTSKHQAEKQDSEEKPSRRVLRPWPPKC